MIDRMCPFCTKSKWNPVKSIYDKTDRIYCGAASSYDGRVESLDQCWLKMSRPQKTKWVKNKKEEYTMLVRMGKLDG